MGNYKIHDFCVFMNKHILNTRILFMVILGLLIGMESIHSEYLGMFGWIVVCYYWFKNEFSFPVEQVADMLATVSPILNKAINGDKLTPEEMEMAKALDVLAKKVKENS